MRSTLRQADRPDHKVDKLDADEGCNVSPKPIDCRKSVAAIVGDIDFKSPVDELFLD
jgi:hypothetical protein